MTGNTGNSGKRRKRTKAEQETPELEAIRRKLHSISGMQDVAKSMGLRSQDAALHTATVLALVSRSKLSVISAAALCYVAGAPLTGAPAIARAIGCANQWIPARLRGLAEAGLVVCLKGIPADGNWPTRRYILTKKGHDLVEQLSVPKPHTRRRALQPTPSRVGQQMPVRGQRGPLSGDEKRGQKKPR